MVLTVDTRTLDEGAELWWRSLDPGTRGVFMQAVWEIEQCPAPRTKRDEPTSNPDYAPTPDADF